MAVIQYSVLDQMDQITHFIDASNVYASEDDEARELRTFRGGRLKVTQVGDKDLLPLNTDMMDECTDPQKNLFCFKAGDARVNEQVELTTMHTMWMREHNRIADHLSKINPYWNDEVIYQEARRIVAAEMQHITYNEWLPIVLGSYFMQNYSLHPLATGYSYQYDPSINPSVTNAFSTAALRFGHTLIQGFLQ
ncbi:unnamed protein product [Notodromas monacha]|uniref:Uncharacterized protein n=1 Tax=Notodromas monacha TaxID=399045 RepID=A0A7R9BZP9_9CRUS|nr:unnamed protein product [Notodromas monacha]CAG0923789.1 unnamed protein product [Notodromas monacha]